MLWVGGHTLVAGAAELEWHGPEDLVHDLAHRLEGLGAVDGVAAWMVDTLVSSAVGLPARLALLGVSTRMAQSTRRR